MEEGPMELTAVQKHSILSKSPGPGNRFCKTFDRSATEKCLICHAGKHSVKWVRRDVQSGSTTVIVVLCAEHNVMPV